MATIPDSKPASNQLQTSTSPIAAEMKSPKPSADDLLGLTEEPLYPQLSTPAEQTWPDLQDLHISGAPTPSAGSKDMSMDSQIDRVGRTARASGSGEPELSAHAIDGQTLRNHAGPSSKSPYAYVPSDPDAPTSDTKLSDHTNNNNPAFTSTPPTPYPDGNDHETPFTTSPWVTLDTGAQLIRAPRHILQKCPLLAHALSRVRHSADPTFDFPVDSTAFTHILTYLRTSTFPLFYTRTSGFDYALYARVQQEAEMFRLWELRDWIREQKYLQAVKVVHEERVERFVAGQRGETVAGNVEVERRVRTRMVSWFNCPRGIAVHRVVRGAGLACGKDCRKVMGTRSEESYYEDVPVTEVVTVKKTFVFDAGVLVAKGGEE